MTYWQPQSNSKNWNNNITSINFIGNSYITHPNPPQSNSTNWQLQRTIQPQSNSSNWQLQRTIQPQSNSSNITNTSMNFIGNSYITNPNPRKRQIFYSINEFYHILKQIPITNVLSYLERMYSNYDIFCKCNEKFPLKIYLRFSHSNKMVSVHCYNVECDQIYLKIQFQKYPYMKEKELCQTNKLEYLIHNKIIKSIKCIKSIQPLKEEESICLFGDKNIEINSKEYIILIKEIALKIQYSKIFDKNKIKFFMNNKKLTKTIKKAVDEKYFSMDDFINDLKLICHKSIKKNKINSDFFIKNCIINTVKKYTI